MTSTPSFSLHGGLNKNDPHRTFGTCLEGIEGLDGLVGGSVSL